MTRLNELLELAEGGGDDVAAQVAWEIGLMPTTMAERRLAAEAAAAELADEYVPMAAPAASADELAKLAEDAGF